ncbi:MAG TPA: hypothetical protein EYQ47_00520 [Cycloclasticus sp.]|jgi:c-di-GMP-binding flagellar brake protein YcgR|nr:hypothetical protein [Cycloclasticus sp.]
MGFLSSLKTLLLAEEKAHDVLNDNLNFILRSSRIKHMLQILVESHVQISILLEEGSEHTSRILDISKNDMMLDQLNSRQAHNKMIKGTSIRVQAKHNSVPFNFTASVIGSANDGSYLISIPKKVYHPQKRAFFRVPLANIEKHKFNGAIQYSENRVSGYVYDVSIGGICIAVYSNTYIRKGALLSPASMTLNGGDDIHTDFTVRCVKKSPQEGFIRVGCEFLNIEPAEKRSIHKFIAQYQRERAKKSS